MSKFYCITFHLYVYHESGKRKVDYGIIPVEQTKHGFKSLVSPEEIEGFKKTKNAYVKRWKNKNESFLQYCIESDLDLEHAEHLYLEEAGKYFNRYTPFWLKFKFSNFKVVNIIKERTKRIKSEWKY